MCVVSSVETYVDWLWFEMGSVCYLCQFKEGVSVANLLLGNQYFVDEMLLYTVPPSNSCVFLSDMPLTLTLLTWRIW